MSEVLVLDFCAVSLGCSYSDQFLHQSSDWLRKINFEVTYTVYYGMLNHTILQSAYIFVLLSHPYSHLHS